MLKKVLFIAALLMVTLLVGPSPTASATNTKDCNNNQSAISYSRNADLSEATVTLKPTYTSCDVSLNSYLTNGPSWATSGKQVLNDHVSARLTSANPTAVLKVKAAPCYYQNDLYFGTTRFDGVDGALPVYPNVVTPKNLIAAFNGGKACTMVPATPTAQVQTTCSTAEVTIRNDFTAAPYKYGEDVTVSIFVDGTLDKDVVVASGTVSAAINYTFPEDSGDHTVTLKYKGAVIGEGTVTTDCEQEPQPQGNGAFVLPNTIGSATTATVITLAAVAAAIAGASLIARRVLSRRV